jgi:hypothetical protein
LADDRSVVTSRTPATQTRRHPLGRSPGDRKILPAAAEGRRVGPIARRRFLDYVRHERALSDNTQAAYRRDLRDFAAWLAGGVAAGSTSGTSATTSRPLAARGLARASIARQAATLGPSTRFCSSRA